MDLEKEIEKEVRGILESRAVLFYDDFVGGVAKALAKHELMTDRHGDVIIPAFASAMYNFGFRQGQRAERARKKKSPACVAAQTEQGQKE